MHINNRPHLKSTQKPLYNAYFTDLMLNSIPMGGLAFYRQKDRSKLEALLINGLPF